MSLQGINHLAFITDDMVTTIRFYRDLLGMKLSAGIGHDGYRHYFFQLADGATHIAFFEYEGATVMQRKFPGDRSSLPLGFDHVSFTVDSREELFALKDRVEAAGVEVEGAVDHGLFWSIYFFDPHNNIPLEATWQFMKLEQTPAISEDDPLDIAAEGAEMQVGHWSVVQNPTPQAEMRALTGNGQPMREDFLAQGLVSYAPGIAAEFQASLKPIDD
jgi:catechol 2,3-dioxygenase-like lactoylglutathione lyase family enzyme